MVFRLGDLWFLVTITPLHVGVGRSPGVVDLPIARDGLGYPWVPASSLKGSVKSLCFAYDSRRECERFYGWEVEGEVPEPYVSPIAFTDAVLLAFPVRILSHTSNGSSGLGYIIPKSSLKRLEELLGFLETIGCCGYVELRSLVEASDSNSVEEVVVNGIKVKEAVKISDVEGLSGIIGGTGFTDYLASQVYVVGDDVALSVIERGVLRVARIRLDRETKTVIQGALWTEEYVSQGAIFFYATLYRDAGGNRRARCAREYHLSLMSKARYYLSIGGKETIGRGLVKNILVSRGGEGDERWNRG